MTLIDDMLQDYALYLRREEKSPATVEKYLRDLGAFRTFAADAPITKALTLAYKQHLIDRGYRPRSVNSMLASLNSFLTFAELTACRVKQLRTQREAYCSEARELTKAEYYRLLEAAAPDRRLQLILQTICATGIRVSELQAFTVEAVTDGDVTVRCKSKHRRVMLPSALRKKLLAYARRRGIRRGCIFISRSGRPLDRSYIWALMKKLCAKAKVDPRKVFPHNLRRLFARCFYAAEKDIAKLADLLGHSSVDTTRIYITTTGSEHRRKIEALGLI